jgi:hypothetical protein
MTDVISEHQRFFYVVISLRRNLDYMATRDRIRALTESTEWDGWLQDSKFVVYRRLERWMRNPLLPIAVGRLGKGECEVYARIVVRLRFPGYVFMGVWAVISSISTAIGLENFSKRDGTLFLPAFCLPILFLFIVRETKWLKTVLLETFPSRGGQSSP